MSELTANEYLAGRLLQKTAGLDKKSFDIAEKLATDFLKWTGSLAGKAVGKGADYLALTLPVAGVLAAVGLAKATSPRAVSENSSDLAINAMEKASLAESLRDYETLKATNALRKKKRRATHDQFI